MSLPINSSKARVVVLMSRIMQDRRSETAGKREKKGTEVVRLRTTSRQKPRMFSHASSRAASCSSANHEVYFTQSRQTRKVMIVESTVGKMAYSCEVVDRKVFSVCYCASGCSQFSRFCLMVIFLVFSTLQVKFKSHALPTDA